MTGRPSTRDPLSLDACVHCGLCLPACPTYDLLGNEADSPRGRLVLMRALEDGAAEPSEVAPHLDACLGCRACETACPSDVPYGPLLERARAELARRRDAVPGAFLLRALATPQRVLWFMRGAWLARRTGLARLAARLPGTLGAMARFTPDANWTPFSRTVPGVVPARGERRGSVTLLPGCVMDQGFADVHAATVRVLTAAGFDVHVPRGPLCCGALHAHAGDETGARAWIDRLSAAVGKTDALVVNAAGCGSHLKDLDSPLAGKTVDALEWLARHGLRFDPTPVAGLFGGGKTLRVAYDDPCHLLHGQGIHDAPRKLLESIPDVDLVDLPDADVCCGSGGIYNVTQPELANEFAARKVAAIRGVAPHVVATANPGCQLQIEGGLRCAGVDTPVVHVLTLLAAACPR